MIDIPWEMEAEVLEIIRRHRPDLKDKTLAECRAIFKVEFPGKVLGRPKRDQ